MTDIRDVEPTIRLARLLLDECTAICCNGDKAGGQEWHEDMRVLAKKHLEFFGLGVTFHADTFEYSITNVARPLAEAA